MSEDADSLRPAEALRTSEMMFSPDPRTGVGSDGELVSLKQHHARIAEVKLRSSVPLDVRTQFEVARNLYLYAWNVYRFYMTAEMQALATLEFGLKTKLPERLPEPYQSKKSRWPTLFGLLSYAIDQKMVRNEGFRRWHLVAEQKARDRQSMEALQFMIKNGVDEMQWSVSSPIVITDEDKSWNLVEHLQISLPKRRNMHAHGSSALAGQMVLGTIELTAEILDQIHAEDS
jgi:hypothetical protein